MSQPKRLYRIFTCMKQRCRDKNHSSYRLYGGKGVMVLWDTFGEFERDMGAAYEAHVAEHGEANTTIDRIDSNGHYEKQNCRWATRRVQAHNIPLNETVSEYFSGLAYSSHDRMKAKYGGEQGYRDHMRKIASKPRKKRSSPYDKTAKIHHADDPSSAVGGSRRPARGNKARTVK